MCFAPIVSLQPKGKTMKNKYTYTKGDCYAICQFLERLAEYEGLISVIAESLGYKAERINNLLSVLHDDIDEILAAGQDTDQTADVMELRHIVARKQQQKNQKEVMTDSQLGAFLTKALDKAIAEDEHNATKTTN